MAKIKIYTIKITNPQHWYSDNGDHEYKFVVDSPVRKNRLLIIFSNTNAGSVHKDDCEIISERYGDTIDELSIKNTGMDLTQKPTC